jgi:hypothetical protein
MTNLARILLKIFATASAVAGSVFCVLSIGFAIYTLYFIQHASHADGTVIALTQRVDDEDRSVTPTFAFKTPAGVSITTKSNTSSNPGFSLGDEVPVLFDPTDPQNAKIATNGQLWLMPIIFGIISVLFTPIGIFLLRTPRIASTPFPFGRTN